MSTTGYFAEPLPVFGIFKVDVIREVLRTTMRLKNKGVTGRFWRNLDSRIITMFRRLRVCVADENLLSSHVVWFLGSSTISSKMNNLLPNRKEL